MIDTLTAADDTGYGSCVQEDPRRDFRVSTRVYTERGIFEAEMRRIFERTWVYVGHESEIPQPGNFKTAALGRLPVIVARDESGKINVLLNACRHRGSVVCRETSGTARVFRCPYHNWVYGLDGKLVGMPGPPGYRAGFEDDIGGLVKAGSVAVYREMIFANMADDPEPLDAFLGPVTKYIDYWFDQSPTGRIRLQAPTRATYPANWKLQLENTTDGWHAQYVHQSAFNTLKDFGNRPVVSVWNGTVRGFNRGHGLLVRPKRVSFPAGMQEKYMEQIESAYGADRVRDLYQTWHITLFPNVHLMESKVRVVQPVSIDKTIVYEYPVQFVGASDELNATLRHRLRSEGSVAAGFVNSDDVEIFSRVESGLRAGHRLEWFYFSRGMETENIEASGERSSDPTHELPQRAIFREWVRLMEA